MNPAIIGGGYAGMAAAVELASRGIPVTVFESAPQLGGRARGVRTSHQVLREGPGFLPPIQLSPEERKGDRPLPGDCLILDNGQHLLLGCYRETLRVIELTGGNIQQDFLRLPLQLDLHGQFSLKAPQLPAPLHLLVALLRAQGLTWSERLKAARFMLAMRSLNFKLPSPASGVTSDLAGVVGQPSRMASSSIRGAGGEGLGEGLEKRLGVGSDMTVSALLAQNGQAADLTLKLWEPLCIAALNTPIHKASAQILLNVLRDALNQSRADSDMLLSRLDFTALFPQRAANFVERNGGKVFTSSRVEAVVPKDGEIELVTADGTHTFSHVICAAPPTVAAKLLRPIATLAETVAQIETLEHQPIYTLYLQYPPTVRLPHPMIGLHRRYSQWLFDKGQVAGHHGLLAAVISAEGIHQELSQEELAQKVIAELREEFGIARQPEWFRTIAEKRATFCCSPNLRRPAQRTSLARLLLAGDYTAGDYPATLEGAVISGVKCADMIGA